MKATLVNLTALFISPFCFTASVTGDDSSSDLLSYLHPPLPKCIPNTSRFAFPDPASSLISDKISLTPFSLNTMASTLQSVPGSWEVPGQSPGHHTLANTHLSQVCQGRLEMMLWQTTHILCPSLYAHLFRYGRVTCYRLEA